MGSPLAMASTSRLVRDRRYKRFDSFIASPSEAVGPIIHDLATISHKRIAGRPRLASGG